jgi:threonine/homoserine/homoserine lactone efflux protein
MDWSCFIKGVVFGFAIAMPVGPIGILCIRRSLTGGRSAGLLTGMGAATADALYGGIAAIGIASVSGWLVRHQGGAQVLGGLFLCALGIRSFLAQTGKRAEAEGSGGAAGNYLSALLLTLTNPMTILSFTALFAGSGLVGAGSGQGTAGWMVAGVFTGSMGWWIILSSASGIFNGRVNDRAMAAINRLSGILLTGFGLAAMIGAIR